MLFGRVSLNGFLCWPSHRPFIFSGEFSHLYPSQKVTLERITLEESANCPLATRFRTRKNYLQSSSKIICERANAGTCTSPTSTVLSQACVLSYYVIERNVMPAAVIASSFRKLFLNFLLACTPILQKSKNLSEIKHWIPSNFPWKAPFHTNHFETNRKFLGRWHFFLFQATSYQHLWIEISEKKSCENCYNFNIDSI